MRILPSSTISLYSGVEIDQDEQLVFKNKANQTAYFNSKKVINETPCTMVKKTGRVRITADAATVSTCNYLSFVNPNFDNKTFYARIIDYDYVNSGDNTYCTIDIMYQIDYWQTWLFDVTFEDCYIEREHLSEADFIKAETNPYDPSIMEFRTGENLPVAEELEKPYYTYGNSNTYDGVYAAGAVCADNNLSNDIGLLLVFSDVDIKNLDGYPDTTPGATSPSAVFWGYVSSLVYYGQSPTDTLNFYKFTAGTFEGLQNNPVVDITADTAAGSKWTSTSLGNLSIGSTNRIKAPVNYIYCETNQPSASNDYYLYFQRILQWFTDNSCLENILGIYPVPRGMIMFSGTANNNPVQVQMPTAASQNVVNRKLDLFPYSYYRAQAPNGDTLELRIEDFRDAQLGNNYCRIALNMDITERPNLIVAPINYKASGASPSAPLANTNIKHALIFSQFPTCPYSISSWEIQLASTAQSIIGNNTVDYSIGLTERAARPSTIKGGLASVVGKVLEGDWGGVIDDFGLSGLVQTGMQAATVTAKGMAADYERLQNENEMLKAAPGVLSGDPGYIAESLSKTRQAYGTKQYHQINGDGVLNFNDFSYMDILILKVTLNPTILAKYDSYFSMYGYSSGRKGIGRALQYTRGASSNDDLPHWTVINNKYTTYLKTTDARVIHSMLPVANAFKSILNSGVRLIRGDLVTP